MPIICTVRTPKSIEEVKAIEEANPDLMQTIGQAAFQHMTRHRRVVTDGEVIDVDEFAERADYDALLAAVGAEIAKYGELTGAVDTVFEVEHDFDFAQMREQQS